MNLLNINEAMIQSKNFTNEQLMTMYVNLKNVVTSRINRREYIIERNIGNTIKRYLDKELSSYEYIQHIVYVGFSPSHTLKDTITSNTIWIGFKYGEEFNGYKNSSYKEHFQNIYEVKIKYRKSTSRFPVSGKFTITVTPPIHHIKEPPYKDNDELFNLKKLGKIKYARVFNPIKDEYSMENRSESNQKTLQDIYGDMLKEIKHFILVAQNL